MGSSKNGAKTIQQRKEQLQARLKRLELAEKIQDLRNQQKALKK